MPVDIKTNPLVEKVQEMGFEGEPVKLIGYPLVSDRKDKIRLYQDLSLAAYFEFDQGDIVHVSESESDSDPTIVLVQPQSQIRTVFKQTIMANALNPTPNPYGPDCQQIPTLNPISDGASNFFAGTAVQLNPKMCRIVPIYKWRLVIKNTPFGRQIYPEQTFVGLGMDCTY